MSTSAVPGVPRATPHTSIQPFRGISTRGRPSALPCDAIPALVSFSSLQRLRGDGATVWSDREVAMMRPSHVHLPGTAGRQSPFGSRETKVSPSIAGRRPGARLVNFQTAMARVCGPSLMGTALDAGARGPGDSTPEVRRWISRSGDEPLDAFLTTRGVHRRHTSPGFSGPVARNTCMTRSDPRSGVHPRRGRGTHQERRRTSSTFSSPPKVDR